MKILLLTLATFVSLTAWAQSRLEGKYIRTDQSTCYLIINSDGTFKYRFGADMQWDVACGRYELKDDSISFQYLADMFDNECNTDGINYTDTAGVILRDFIDKRFRPISARILKNRIRTYLVGDIDDPASLDELVYTFRRKKRR